MRCIFILLANGGISLEQIDSLLTWQIHIPSHLLLLISINPLAVSGPILTGSITSSLSYFLAEGQSVTDIPGGFPEEFQSTTPVCLPKWGINPELLVSYPNIYFTAPETFFQCAEIPINVFYCPGNILSVRGNIFQCPNIYFTAPETFFSG